MFFQKILYGAVFLICVAVLAKVRSRGARQGVLLLGSYAVYLTWGQWFATVLLISTIINFLLGKWVQRAASRIALFSGILFNLALLGSFKYLPEAATGLPFSSLQRFAHLALPLGISFWTFQAMSYLFDLYREEKIDPTLLEFALYMAFFPVVIAGPVCRMPEMLPQFRAQELTKFDGIVRGLRRVATGVLMMQVAKLLGQGVLAGDGVNRGFDQVTQWSGADVWCLALGYGLQLFFDFAGYSQIAIGAAEALGIIVPENFARPWSSTTISVFWTRWHMSLSFWIRDYVFFPLATLRREVWWRNFALAAAMIVFGVWHKATLLFVVWGAYHGLLLVLHRQVQALERRFELAPRREIWALLSWGTTMACVTLGWIFFRANSPAQAWQMLRAVASLQSYETRFISGSLYLLVALVALGYAVVVTVSETMAKAESSLLARTRWYWVPPLYVSVLLVIVAITHAQGTDAAQLMYRNF